MKKVYLSVLALAFMGISKVQAQTPQMGPNLLGAKGTFSAPFVQPRQRPSSYSSNYCVVSGNNAVSPADNIGKKLDQLSSSDPGVPKSGYTYVYKKDGLVPEFTYTLIRIIGQGSLSGGMGNCIKGDWRGQDATGDNGWFMAVNGAPNNTQSPIFYRIEDIDVCPGTEYQFSAKVINLLPGDSPAAGEGSEPNISFVIKGNDGSIDTIARSGAVAYHNIPEWVTVGGAYTAGTSVTKVTLEVVNSTAVASGNDLGLDDISFNVLESSIGLSGDLNPMCVDASAVVNFTVNDVTETNSWYKWQVSTNGGTTFTDSTAPAQATFSNGSYTLTLTVANLQESMNGRIYRLVAGTSPSSFGNPNCSKYVQNFAVRVNACGPTPVDLMNFNGRYNNGQVSLDWQTAQEFNSDKFEIYRSENGQNFALVGSVKSAGYSGDVKSYSFVDGNPGSSQYVYYKLKQIDLDGKFIYTNVVKVAVGGLKASLQAYPNPFSTHFTASFSANKTADATITLRNSIGQPVMVRTLKVTKGNNTVDISNLPPLTPGVYYATIHNDDINYNIKLQKQ
ncbi:MAG: T9SS type A sorting domain-containing protein [Chitinophagaceae bacterium]|nr:T9SS type A sorting domain-containing protein [Chitinophagaceae bacterium]